jgi:hypothetical protein
MDTKFLVSLLLMAFSVGALAQETEADAPESESPVSGQAEGGVKTMSGMSILGNEEAPKSLVIVPWKSSQLGDGIGIENALDQRPRAVDREVFMRELHFFELRTAGED